MSHNRESQERTRPARSALAAKVTLLEEWIANESIPPDAPVLVTIKDVQQWTDPARGLVTWTSYSIAAPGGPNADLRLRLDHALKSLQRIREGKSAQPRKPRRGRPISQIQVSHERDRLAHQNVELLVERDALSAEVKRLRHLLLEKEHQHRELLIKFEKIVPFGKR
ncbi:hypothetical protein [Microvirga sp. TS319]|uniref:hypothetical protein n=1 Tax=Microvirga sp. TS319 TaxID=3241165 RepID=UPI00351A070B